MELKTIVCPNCGANTTNVRNCEYCNSLLVRFVDKGIDVNKTSYLTGDCAFPELLTALKQNLHLQEKYPFEPTTTEIAWLKKGEGEIWSTTFVDILRSGYCAWQDYTSIDLGEEEGGLIVIFSFGKSGREQLEKFKKLSSFPLFVSHNHFDGNDYVREYAIDFGKDAEGAAMLVSEILSEVFDLNPTDDYDIITVAGKDELENARVEWEKAHGLLEDDESDEQENNKQILYYVIGGIIFVLYCILTNF